MSVLNTEGHEPNVSEEVNPVLKIEYYSTYLLTFSENQFPGEEIELRPVHVD